uniref:Aminotransferase class V domain-containing protein n=1 Tax=Bionectria ochroleuca TaxID=29856 RepID=A0A0B7KK60_BIOOC
MGQKLSAGDTGSPKAPAKLGHGLLKEFQFDEGWRNLNHVAQLVNAPLRDVVFVGNATEGVNTVLRNLHWNPDGRDAIISFGTIYDAMARAEDFVVDYFKDKVVARDILLTYPVEDDEILRLFRETVRGIEAEGKRARVAVFDVVSSNPGVVFPWEAVTAACRELGVLSLVDGAQGIGMVHLDLKTTDPDFFVSNCHKWLHVPRGCAVFYVPERNHKLIPSSLATSRGHVAGVLGTEYLDNKTGTMTNCGMGNVGLPLWVAKEEGGGKGLVLSREEANAAFNFMAKALMDEYKTFVALYVRWDRFWVRISAQVYLEMEDYEWLAKVLKELGERVVKGEFRSQKQQD